MLRSSTFGPHEGSKRTPETMQEAEREARDGTQKRTNGNLEEVTSTIIRGELPRLGGLFAAGAGPTQPLRRGDLLRLGSCLALGRRPFLAQMGLVLGKCSDFLKYCFSSCRAIL